MSEPASRRTPRIVWTLVLALVLLAPAPASATPITVRAHHLDADGSAGALLPSFTYIVNEDNANDPDRPRPAQAAGHRADPEQQPGRRGRRPGRPTVDLPDGRYLISIRSPEHKLWGKHITLRGTPGTSTSPSARARFRSARSASSSSTTTSGRTRPGHRRAWAGGLPCHARRADRHPGQRRLQQRPAVRRRLRHRERRLRADRQPRAGDVLRRSDAARPLRHGWQGHWVQTSTFDGGFHVQTGVEEGSDGTGAPGEALWEPPDRRTGYFFGFVCTATDFPNPGTGSITGAPRTGSAGRCSTTSSSTPTSPSRTRTSRSATRRPTPRCSSARATATATSASRTSLRATTCCRSGTSSSPTSSA